ncbi:tandem-95 repeat protein [Candidatus Desantisbacteria bacterium]|nr:tandem-95 repeat protein [Candidatus Desantisbacteria bacterium]
MFKNCVIKNFVILLVNLLVRAKGWHNKKDKILLRVRDYTRRRYIWAFKLSFFLFFISINFVFAGSWQTGFVDAPKYFSDMSQRSIAIDKITNNPHIVYGGYNLYHAYYNGSSWQYEIIDNDSGVGKYASIVMDSNNKIHISYSGNNCLKYATNASGTWTTTIVDSIKYEYVGEYTSIAVDSNDKIHISYYDDSNNDLKYATNESGLWIITTVDSYGYVGQYTSIAVDSNDKIHISYYDDSNNDLKYATNESGSWVTTTVDSYGYTGQYSSIAIDTNNKIHISYYYDMPYGNSNNPQRYKLKYATNESGTWTITTVDGDGRVGKFSSIAIDTNNKVHISYYYVGNDYENYRDFSYNDLKYATNKSGSWITTTVDSNMEVGRYTSIAIDSNDKVHISYYDDSNKDLKYVTNASDSWVRTTADSYEYVGEYNSIAVDSKEYNSIAVDSNDKIHISYYDDSNKDLKYATNSSGLWITTTVDSYGYVGQYTSIAVDSNDKIHISYYDDSNNDLKYATNASGSWVTTTVDSINGSVGKYTSIDIDSNDKVHISYCDNTNRNLKYATNKSGSWGTSTVDSNNGYYAEYTSIVVDLNNMVHISYNDFFNADLIYATNESGSWITTIVDNTWITGIKSSISIDKNNKIHISYCASDYLKYATKNSELWSTADVDKIGYNGYTSIAIDSNNRIYISYFDLSNYNLKYATKEANIPPIANAGTDQNVNVGTKVILNGSSSNDPNGDNITYLWTQISGANITLSNSSSVSPTFSPNSADIYIFQLIVNDGKTNSSPDTVTITVNTIPNNSPVANNDNIITNEDTATIINALSNDTDADGDTLVITGITQGTKGVAVNNNDGGTVTYTPIPNLNGADSFTYIISDGKGGYDTGIVQVTITAINDIPVANSGADQTVNIGMPATLNGANSTDPDGDILTYAWTQVSGTNVTLSNPNSVSPVFTSDSAGSYEFQLIVNDGQTNSAPDKVMITVNNISIINNPPTANAGKDQTVKIGTQVTLDGSASNDPDKDTITYSWTQTSGPTVTLSNLNTVSSTFTPGSAGTYEFQLIVNDGQVNSTPDTVTIAVNSGTVNTPAASAGGGKKGCIITNTIKNKTAVSFINSIKDKYLLQNEFARVMLEFYYKITTKLE